MADPQYSDLPAGAQIVSTPNAGSNPAQQFSDVPEGAQVVSPSTSGQPAPQSSVQPEDARAGIGMGFLKGAGETALGAVSATSKLLHKIPVIGETLAPEAGIGAMDKTRESLTPTTPAQKVGYGGETLTEFMLGDEALKGLSLAKKLSSVSKVMSLFEESPRLMKVAQLGAEALRQGTVQGAQTLAKTGGDVGEAAKEGATMAATSGALSAVGAGVGSVLKKAGKASQTVETLGKVAEAAPTKEEVTDSAKAAVDTAKQQMHDKFEAGVQDLKDRLGDAEIPHADSSIATTAKELIKAPEPAEHGLVAAAKDAAGERMDKPVKNLLNKAASMAQEVTDDEKQELAKSLGKKVKDLSSEDIQSIAKPAQAWKAGDLIDFRQAVRKLADTYPPGDPNARALYKLLPSVDDSLGKLAEVSGDDTAKADYSALRKDYKDKIKFFQPSGKLQDKIAYSTANVLRTGSKDDIGNYLMSGGNSRAKVDAVKELLGDDGAKEIGKNVFGTIVADSKGNPANLVKSWSKIPDEVKTSLFDTTVGEKAINDLMQDAKGSATIQQLIRVGVAGGIGAGAGSLMHTGLGTLLGLAIGEAHAGGLAGGRQILDYVATHPAVWKSLGIAGKVGETASSRTGQAVGTVLKQQTGRGLSSVMQGAAQPLGEENNEMQ